MVKECKKPGTTAIFTLHIMKISKDTPISQLTCGQFEALLKHLNYYLQSDPSNEVYLNTRDAAEFIRKSPQALRQIVYNKKIKHIKRGNNLLFLKSDLIDWIEDGRQTINYLDSAEEILNLRVKK